MSRSGFVGTCRIAAEAARALAGPDRGDTRGAGRQILFAMKPRALWSVSVPLRVPVRSQGTVRMSRRVCARSKARSNGVVVRCGKPDRTDAPGRCRRWAQQRPFAATASPTVDAVGEFRSGPGYRSRPGGAARQISRGFLARSWTATVGAASALGHRGGDDGSTGDTGRRVAQWKRRQSGHREPPWSLRPKDFLSGHGDQSSRWGCPSDAPVVSWAGSDSPRNGIHRTARHLPAHAWKVPRAMSMVPPPPPGHAQARRRVTVAADPPSLVRQSLSAGRPA